MAVEGAGVAGVVISATRVVLPNGASLKENLPFRERPIISGRLGGGTRTETFIDANGAAPHGSLKQFWREYPASFTRFR